ncbi:WHG domain-containing protein [Xanthomonas campestris pv. campestris]|uniref:TetR/AcrR family transcriptional regulator n=1 Tax=Xanthomonas campestris TaxID=339 RepID=UPI002378F684|nr:WHG domain-containing protein [Xanthomonas campestris]MDO0863054.1 WHG domain-containing protein [Xanthomonas campestris pv. campestris]MEB1202321.1 WHG domain-containing protein [Xanthomonas campestris pv. campestris]MEB1238221.1 WHG domain-containing protein [Xanthomonas campestris pv. campestris]MEB1482718.1 WHG domain-containing protein [Xanthomonas campestris pv. campestris]MEB1502933.1 WHG domain-containing protein [Xanthomonas campestris pv. campestris]
MPHARARRELPHEDRTVSATATPSDAPGTYHHGDLPAALRRAAWEIVAESGARALTLRACARRAGVSHAAPAHHFGSLNGLVAEMVADGYERMVARIAATQQDVSDPVMGCGLGYIRFAIEFPQHFRLMLSLDLRAHHLRAHPLPRLAQASEAARACLRNALSTAWCAQHGRPPPAELLQQRTLLAWSAAHGYAALAIDHPAQSVPLFPPELIFAPLIPALLAP